MVHSVLATNLALSDEPVRAAKPTSQTPTPMTTSSPMVSAGGDGTRRFIHAGGAIDPLAAVSLTVQISRPPLR
jgi:hypothetical protein